MGDSRDKYDELSNTDELEQLRDKYSGQPLVRCASGEPVDFDFTNVKREHITYAMNGKDIRAKAKIIGSVESKICYLKLQEDYALIVNPNFSDLKNAEHIVVHKDKTISKVQNREFNEPSMYPHGKFSSNFNNKSFNFTSLPWKVLEDPDLFSEQDKFQIFVRDYCNKLADLLIQKNKSYGNAAMDPIRVFSSSDSEEQLRVRIDDKLSRIKRGNNSFNEDTIQDLQGYLVLLQYKKSQE